MSSIIRIELKSISGICPEDFQYSDSLTLTPTGVQYVYEPVNASPDNMPAHWSYQTDSADYVNRYDIIAEKSTAVMDEDTDALDPENPTTTLSLELSDGQRIEKVFSTYDSETLNDLYISILSLLPICEALPAVLGLIDGDDEDFEEDEEDF